MEYKRIKLSDIVRNEGQVAGLPSNPRQWTKRELDQLKKSLKETPELLEARGILVYPHEGKYIILGGNMRYTALSDMKEKDAPCIVVDPDTPADKLRELVVKDNGTFGSWDFDALANEWDDLPLTDWGVPAWEAIGDESGADKEDEQAEIERKRKEFEDRMKAGEITEEDEEYQEFLEKFKLKKTTDDCYTPAVVHEAVVSFVERKYNLNRVNFMRPFCPGGDYQKEIYNSKSVVVDNPPFSILSEILKFYDSNGIKFFLYAPHLTLFSSSSHSCTALPTGVAIVYENGASVNTSFLTNLEPKGIRLRSEPELYKAVKEANDANLKEMRKELPKYSYDHHIVTSTFVGRLSRLGIDFSVPVAESEPISQLEAQKESGKAIFGKGYIVSDQVFAEREKAEREKAEREKAERWELSPKELKIVKKLSTK